ncbi:acetamidase/formamidase family protein [Sphingobium sp.]|uniref:acetamidase/formamidase family protein n=1 Tax=Sphingobium sp. TaxID=1912891 RepID=UPI0028BD67E0|nr:acetamidase/formamidase family protein [Sphingobium sp.]
MSGHLLGKSLCNKTIHSCHEHNHWDNACPPAAIISPGETVEFYQLDASSGQITRDTKPDDLLNLDFSLMNPIAGPIYVDGAEPGDALKVSLLDFGPSGWGWTGVVPNFGLLSDDFLEPALNIWSYDVGFGAPAMFGKDARIPMKPFCGTIGVAPAAPGLHSTIPPTATGGNMDIRDLALGVDLYLPVEVAGGLFSIGDPHAAQGDGEVCGSAIETPMAVAVKIDLVKQAGLRFPRFTTHGPVTNHLDAKGYEVTVGIGPDLMEASRNAVRGMIDLLSREHHLPAERAYMLCSVAGDLRISEIVDIPNWTVSFYMPRMIFN